MIALTGGAGFIGSCLLKKLNDEDISDIFVVDYLGSSNKWKNLVGKKFLRFFDPKEFLESIPSKQAAEDIDVIIHLGACSDTTEKDADYVFQNNLNYSIKLAEFAAYYGIKFIYASSAATYGNGSNGYSDEVFDELRPLNVYGLSKHLFDQWIIENELDDSFTGLKLFNVYGPNEYHKGEMASMIYKSFLQIQNSDKVKLFKSNHPNYKDGEQKRDFVYVKDAVEIIWKILNSETINGIFNLGSGKAREWNDLAKSVFRALGKEPNIEYIEMPNALAGQYQNFTQADMTKLSKTDCIIDFTDLEDGVEDYVKNYLTQQWQYM